MNPRAALDKIGAIIKSHVHSWFAAAVAAVGVLVGDLGTAVEHAPLWIAAGVTWLHSVGSTAHHLGERLRHAFTSLNTHIVAVIAAVTPLVGATVASELMDLDRTLTSVVTGLTAMLVHIGMSLNTIQAVTPASDLQAAEPMPATLEAADAHHRQTMDTIHAATRAAETGVLTTSQAAQVVAPALGVHVSSPSDSGSDTNGSGQ